MQRYRVQNNLTGHPKISNIIAVGSAKGGVGKSTVTTHLAVCLAQQGLAVGVLDADIYGPSQSMMLGVQARPDSQDGKSMQPLFSHGVYFMSMAALVDEQQAMIWRGPMVSRTLMQLLDETNWPELDILLVDLPPGTGDVQLTLSQKIPLAGAVVVTTPQEIALMDAVRGVKLFEELNVSVLGVVENMAMHRCTQCGHEDAIFGEQHDETLEARLGAPLLGSLMLNRAIREAADAGVPIGITADESNDVTKALHQSFKYLADEVLFRLCACPKDYSSMFGSIKLESS